MKSVKYVVYGQQFEMGPLTIRQPLPVGGINQVSPFVLVHLLFQNTMHMRVKSHV